jgi:hypothetical protein
MIIMMLTDGYSESVTRAAAARPGCRDQDPGRTAPLPGRWTGPWASEQNNLQRENSAILKFQPSIWAVISAAQAARCGVKRIVHRLPHQQVALCVNVA